jgi:hypothetical protein
LGDKAGLNNVHRTDCGIYRSSIQDIVYTAAYCTFALLSGSGHIMAVFGVFGHFRKILAVLCFTLNIKADAAVCRIR